MPQTFTKQPSEAMTIALECWSAVPRRTTLLSGTVSAIRNPDSVPDNSVLGDTNITVHRKQAKVWVQGGTSGKTYRLTFRVLCSDGSVLEEDIDMAVTEQ